MAIPQPQKNEMSKFFTASVLSLANIFLAILLALILSPYILRATGDRLYGIFVLVSSVTGWFGLLDFGIGTSVSRFVTLYHTRKDDEACNRVASSAFFLFLAIGLFCFIVSCLIIAGTWYFCPDMADRIVFSQVLFFFGLAFLVNFPTNVCEGVLCGVLRHDVNAARLIVFRLTGALATFLAIWFGGKVVSLAIVNLVVNTLNLAIVYYLARRVFPQFRPSLRFFSREHLRTMFRYGVPVFNTQLGETILNRSGILIISIMIAIDAATPYSLVIVSLAGYAEILFMAVTQWQTNWFTQLYENGDSKRFAQARRTVRKTSIYLVAFIGFGYIFWGHPFIERWIGAKYLDSYPSLVVAAIGFWLTCGVSKTNWRLMLATARHVIYSRLVLIHALLAVALGIVFVRLGYGMLGVVLANVICAVPIYNGIAAFYTCREMGEKLRYYYLFNLRSQLIAILCLIPSFILARYASASYISLFAIGAASLASYALLIFIFGLTHDERRTLLRRGNAP